MVSKGIIMTKEVVNLAKNIRLRVLSMVYRAKASHVGSCLSIADIVAVKGNPIERFKLLEYPDLVMSGGQVVVNKYVK